MAENTLLEKVLSLQDKYKKLEEQLAAPEVIADMKKFVQLNKDYKELQPIIAAGLEYKRLMDELSQAKDILMNEKDEDLNQSFYIFNICVRFTENDYVANRWFMCGPKTTVP